jgi:hypothetical protein
LSDDDVDVLFALPPAEFVAARDELARRLRADGHREGAQDVRKLRRPSVPAWAVNQLARTYAADLDSLLEAGRALQHAQRAALSGVRGSGLREATTRRRQLIDDLVDRAVRLLTDGGHSPEPHRAAIAATLEAATVDDDAAQAVLGGRLSKELPPPTGFGDLTGLSVVPAEPAPAPPPPPKREDNRAARRAELERALARAEGRAEEAELQARDAGQTADAARREADAAADALTELERQLEDARDRARTAQRHAREARDAASKARRTADNRTAEAEQARARLVDLAD